MRLGPVLAWLPAVLLVPTAMAAAVVVSQPEGERELAHLSPMDLGTTWVYAVESAGEPSGTHTRQVTGKAGISVDVLDAVTVENHYTDYPGRGASRDLLYLGETEDSVDQHGVFANGEHVFIDPPAPAYRLPVEEGTEWSWKGTVGTSNLTTESVLEEIVDVEVGGREFTDCAHYVTELVWSSEQGEAEEHYEEWTCPGYGAVRTIDRSEAFGLDLTEELIAFHGLHRDWVAEDPPAVTADDVPGATVGLDAARSAALPDAELTDELAWSDVRSADIAFPPVADGDLLVVGEDNGWVSATDLTDGSVPWRVQVTQPVVAPPVVGGGLVLVADSRKALWALDVATGTTRWVHDFEDVVSASPLLVDGTVIVPSDDGAVTALSLSDGEELWQEELDARVRTAPALDADTGTVLVGDEAGTVTAYDVDSGDERWSHGLEGSLTAGPAVADGLVLTGDDQGVVSALEVADGEVAWQTRTRWDPMGDFAVADGVAALKGGLGRLEAFGLEDGAKLWSREVPDTDESPIVVGSDVVTVSEHGKVSAWSLETGDAGPSFDVPAPAGRRAMAMDVAIGHAGGSLLLTGETGAESHGATVWAYRVSGDEPGMPGVAFGSEVRAIPASPAAPPAMVGDTLLVPATDQALYRSTGLDEVEALHRSKGMQPGVVVSEGVAIGQADDEVRGYDVETGEQLWRFPAAEPFPGSVPAVLDGSVFVPEHGLGLAGLGLDGAPRWFTPIENAMGSSPPLALPDGDVVHGSGTLARYDGATGDRLWAVEGAQTFAGAAYDGDLVFADLIRVLGESGLAALDADTGKVRWFHANASVQSFVGPVAAEGTVVYGDSTGLVQAFDSATGKLLWDVRLSTPMAGTPMIRDGKVYLSEAGRREDIFQRDYRVSVHQLRTGAFLGGFQPPGQDFVLTPSVAGTEDGRLLVPAVTARGSVIMVLEELDD